MGQVCMYACVCEWGGGVLQLGLKMHDQTIGQVRTDRILWQRLIIVWEGKCEGRPILSVL